MQADVSQIDDNLIFSRYKWFDGAKNIIHEKTVLNFIGLVPPRYVVKDWVPHFRSAGLETGIS